MSRDPRVNEVLERIPNRFLLSLAVAKRARQLKEGSPAFIEVQPNMTVIDIALEEFRQGKIEVQTDVKRSEDDELLEEVAHSLDLASPPAYEEPVLSKKEAAQKSKAKSLLA